MPSYVPPLYNAICTALLITKKVILERQFKDLMETSIDKYGLTICPNGWNNVQNRPLLNFVQCGTKGNVFLGHIDTTGHYKDHAYLLSKSNYLWIGLEHKCSPGLLWQCCKYGLRESGGRARISMYLGSRMCYTLPWSITWKIGERWSVCGRLSKRQELFV